MKVLSIPLTLILPLPKEDFDKYNNGDIIEVTDHSMIKIDSMTIGYEKKEWRYIKSLKNNEWELKYTPQEFIPCQICHGRMRWDIHDEEYSCGACGAHLTVDIQCTFNMNREGFIFG